MLFNTHLKITEQIVEYTHWKAARHPYIAGAQRSLLYRFVRANKFRDVSDIRVEHIAFFAGEELTQFYSEDALKAIRGFLWYCRKAGYKCIPSQMATKDYMQKATIGRPVQWDMVREVKLLKGRGLPERKISAVLTEKYKRPIYHTSVHRWKKLIPKLG